MITATSENDDQVNQNMQESYVVMSDKAVTNGNYRKEISSDDEAVLDEMNLESHDTRTTKEEDVKMNYR